MLQEFATTRLVFRPMAEADAAVFCDLYSDAETMRFIGEPLSHERATRGFRSALKLMRRPTADQAFFTLSARESGECVGIGSIQHLDIAGRSAEVGMIICSPYRDRGFAREGLSGLIGFAFAQLPIDEAWARVHADHTVVEKLVISVGLTRGSKTQAHDGDAVMRVWSAQRDSWQPRPES
jgi:RimJ/RimL family protein N-acetyltransferase